MLDFSCVIQNLRLIEGDRADYQVSCCTVIATVLRL